MKRMNGKTILLSVIMAVTITGCGGKDDNTTKYVHVKVERCISIDNSKDSPQCQVKLDIMQATDTASEAGRRKNALIVSKIFDMEQLGIQAAADSFANLYTRDYRKHMAPLYREDRSDQTKRPWYEYRYTVTTETRQGRKGLTNYLIKLNYYEGGAHGIEQLLTLNIDDATGQAVTLKNVLGDDYEGHLQHQLLEALQEKTGTRDLKELHDRGYLYSMDIFVPENYIIGDDEITFIFNPYEIAPYSEGRIELTLDVE